MSDPATKYAFLAVFTLAVASLTFAQSIQAGQEKAKQSCVIVQHTEMTGIATWSRNYRPLEYVWGDFPEGMKFKSGLRDGDIRKIQQKGGRVIVLPKPYTHDDLEDAKKSCESGQKK